MVMRVSWRSYEVGDRDAVTVYWFPQGSDWRFERVTRALGLGVAPDRLHLTTTAQEREEWAAAAAVYVDEVAAALGELRRVQARTRFWRRRPLVRRWGGAVYERAKASYLDRVAASTAAYRPVREAVEARLAELEAARQAEIERQREAYQRRRAESEARYQVWERRQQAADQPLPGGLTPRELAARGEEPARWPPGIEAAVGDVAAWWDEVRGAVRNAEARARAVREFVAAVGVTTAWLDQAGRPGMRHVNAEPSERRDGWWITFDWTGLPDDSPLRTPPDMPVGHLWAGEWDYDLYLPRRILLSPERHGGYRFATVTTEDIGNGMARRHKWWLRDPPTFAEHLFPARISYRERYHMYRHKDLPMTDHADPAVYVPYVEAVAERAIAAVTALTGPA